MRQQCKNPTRGKNPLEQTWRTTRTEQLGNLVFKAPGKKTRDTKISLQKCGKTWQTRSDPGAGISKLGGIKKLKLPGAVGKTEKKRALLQRSIEPFLGKAPPPPLFKGELIAAVKKKT
ncbi:hypothetical protein JTB14_011437 [Gonioctena quinquepunctata]|nr:hypothetical protein JTB14_011437 [Gonioctena quinquepunctata]